MRENKYRAWNSHKKEMYSHDELVEMDMEEELNYCTLLRGLYSEVKPSQYSGMNDKNGVEVFEGDIVELLTKYGKDVGVVVFIDGCFKVRWDSKNKFPKNREMTGHYYINSKTKVIGNIYENSELIKV